MKNDKVLLVISDENGASHRITSRNLRAYKGRELRCACGEGYEIDDPPLTCPTCQTDPEVLLLDKNIWWNQPALERSSVLIIGCGAVGNEVAKSLAMMGIGKLTLIDFDELEDHNLSRAVLFNAASKRDSEDNKKVNVMAEGIKLLNPEIEVVARPAGILDPISARKRGVSQNPTERTFEPSELAERMRWPEVIEKEELQQLGREHSLCIIATDGVAPKAAISKALYPILPIVQGAMNETGSTVAVRVSLPGITGCIMCPSVLENVELDADGSPAPYIAFMRSLTGSGGCDQHIEAAGAASFTDSTSAVGAAMVSQSILILMGWEKFEESDYKRWPIIPPLWDEVMMITPRIPANSSMYTCAIRYDRFGQPICVNSCSADLEWDEHHSESPRMKVIHDQGTGVPKPGSQKRKLGS